MTRRSPTRTKPILMRPHRSELAGAETVGAVILLSVVVTAISVASVGILNAQPAPIESPPLEFVADWRTGSDTISLKHTEGASLDRGDLRILVDVDDVRVLDVPAGSAGQPWTLGGSLVVGPLPVVPVSGQRVEVSIVSSVGADGGVLSTTRVPIGTASTIQDAAGPTIAAAGGPAPIELRPTQNFLAQATVDHIGGRKIILSVTAQVPGLGSSVRLYDDGTTGDAVAGDGHYVVPITIPVGAIPGLYPIIYTVTDLQGTEVTTVGWIRVLATTLPEGQLPDPVSAPLSSPDLTPSVDPSSTETPEEPPTTELPPVTTPTPAFAILPSGGVSPLCAQPMTLKIVGTQITYGAGGPNIPVRVNLTQNGGSTFTPLFGGAPVTAGQTVTYNTPAGAVVGVHGDARYSTWHYAYDSFTSDPHVKVLKNGSAVPNVAGFANQASVASFLAPYIANGLVSLAPNQVIVLYEFNPSLTSSAADYQDLVVLLDFATNGCP